MVQVLNADNARLAEEKIEAYRLLFEKHYGIDINELDPISRQVLLDFADVGADGAIMRLIAGFQHINQLDFTVDPEATQEVERVES